MAALFLIFEIKDFQWGKGIVVMLMLLMAVMQIKKVNGKLKEVRR